MIKRLVIIVTLLGIGLTAQAQEGTSSPYSFYGIGLTKFKGTAEQRGMAGLSVYSDSIHVNLQNPAGIAKLGLTAFSVGASHQVLNISDGTGEEQSTSTTFDYLSLAFPAGKFSFGLSVYPSTAVGYRIVSEDGDDPDRPDQFTGRGGLNKVAFATAYNISDNLSLGIDLQYNFGNIQNRSLRFQDEIQFGSREINRSDFLGFSYKFGAYYEQMLTEKYQITASATYLPSSSINVENFREVATVLVGSNGQEAVSEQEDVDVQDTDFDNPAELSIGLGIGQPKLWYIGAEYSNAQKSNFNNRTFSDPDVQFDDASRFRLGGFYIPKYNDVTSYFNRIVYRAGARYEETGLNLRGEGINEFGISFGVGLPVGQRFTNANVSFEYGQRGTASAGLVEESFFNIIIGLSLNDKWFERRKFN